MRIHLTWLQAAFVIVLAVALVAALFWAVGKISRSRAPAETAPGRPSGVGGLLLAVIVYLFATGLWPLFNLGQNIGEVIRVAMMDASFVWPVVQTLIPDAVAGILLPAAALTLMLGRTPSALMSAVALMWIGGPLTAFLRAYFLQIPITWTGTPSTMTLGFFIATVYLLCANRSTLTYGTART